MTRVKGSNNWEINCDCCTNCDELEFDEPTEFVDALQEAKAMGWRPIKIEATDKWEHHCLECNVR